jgi:molybdopterin-guanine dinucleotide biosynthesis protein B
MSDRLFGVVGWKNSGKTTLTTRLVAELVRRGWRVSTVKHAHHAFDIDHENTDSWRHRHAGAGEVAIVSGKRWALMHELRGENEPSLADILARLAPCDIVIIEGYKRETHPKIEVRRVSAADHKPLAPDDPAVIAIASDQHTQTGTLPWFDVDDITAIADFAEQTVGLRADAA